MSLFPPQPDESAGQVDHRLEVASKFFVASGDAAEVLERCKEVLYKMAKLVEVGVELRVWFLAVGFTRYDRVDACIPRLVANGF